MGSYSHGYVSARELAKRAPRAACPRCGAQLSVYRLPAESICAPCLAATRLT